MVGCVSFVCVLALVCVFFCAMVSLFDTTLDSLVKIWLVKYISQPVARLLFTLRHWCCCSVSLLRGAISWSVIICTFNIRRKC